jgi:hypothetical protein
MKIVKLLRSVLIAVIILIALLVVGFHFYGAQAMKLGVETGASMAIHVPVTVEKVDLSIFQGHAGLTNLIVANPPGYQHKNMLELGTAQLNLDIKSVFSDTINIENILLENMTVVLEQKGLTGNNIQDVIDSMASSKKETKTETQPTPGSPGKKLLIKNLQINEVTVNAKLLPVPGKVDTITIKLPPVTMHNLGSDDKLDTAALANKILLIIVDGIAKQGAGLLPADMINSLNAGLQEVRKLPENIIKEGSKAIETGVNQTKEAAEKAIGDTQKQLKDGIDTLIKKPQPDEKK